MIPPLSRDKNGGTARFCARRGCRNGVRQAFDVWSWFKPQEKQTPAHYEVCDKHASYFTGSFDRLKGEAVKRDLIESLRPDGVDRLDGRRLHTIRVVALVLKRCARQARRHAMGGPRPRPHRARGDGSL